MISNSKKISKEEGSREFWASIKEPYDFIMSTHLIPDSFEVASDHLLSSCAEMELSWDSEDVSPHYVWSYSEFLDQYNELYEWLIQVQLQLYSHSNPPDINSRLDQQEELRRRTYRRNLFVEQGEKVAKKYPASEDEIKWRVNYLNNKWEQLQSTLTPGKGRSEDSVELDLDHEEKLLRGWLGTMEGQIQPITCKLPRGCSLHALQERYKDNQILLKDIKAHGSILKSVVQQYERQTPSNEPDPTLDLSSRTTPDAKRSSFRLSPDIADNRDKSTSKSSRVKPRRAKSLEKRYHQIYLRSLEWHYYLEGAIADFKEQDFSSCSSSESDDEPVSKCRRISKASLPSLPPQSVRRKPCSLGWSEYEANSSEAGSYIEDDYVMTSSEAYASRKVVLEENNSLRKEDKVRGKLCMESQHPLSLMVATTVDQNNSVVKMNSCNNNLSNVTTVNNFEPKLQNNNNSNASDREIINLNNGSTNMGLKTVGRPSPNCGVFECKHNDTDSDSNSDTESKEIATETIINKNTPERTISSCTITSKNKDEKDVYEDEDMIQEDLQQIIDSAILDQDWLNSNITTTDSDGSSVEEIEEQHSIKPDNETETPPSPKRSYSPCNKQSIHRLVNDAEHLVREPLNPGKPHLKPLPLGMPNKQLQIKQWLYSQGNDATRFVDGSHIQDSCDASGELTTGESEDSDKEGFDTSLATEKGTSVYLHSSENTPTMEGSPLICFDEKKVKLRGKKRQRATQRPWSVTDENQLFLVQNKVPAFELQDNSNKTVLSSSEPSLHSIERSSPKAFQNQTYSHSYPKIWHSSWVNSPDSLKSSINVHSPTVGSDSINLSGTSSKTKDADSVGYLRRKGKLRRRSNRHLLGIRTESGSDGIGSVSSRRKGGKLCAFSPYNSPTKSLSSESETVSGCPKPVKVFFSGDCGSQTRQVMSSSTEKCLSDSSVVSGASHTSRTSKLNINNKINGDDLTDSKKSNKNEIVPSQPNHLSDQEASVHLEDASSLSEQAWDSYQEYKYLSEPYSEDVDVDAERKLLEFGDDYRNFIDSDGSSFNGLLHRSRRTTPRHRRMRMRRNSDSESDLEDLHQVISESKNQLSAMEKMLNSYVGEAAIGLDLEDVINATEANLKFLRDILKHLNREAPKMISEFSDLQSIVDRWGNVQAKALERQQQSAQFRQLQRQIKSLRMNMESVLSRCSSLTLSHTVENFAQLPKRVEDMKNLLGETESLRTDLSGLNVIVHRFSTEMGPAFTPLKDEMAELYRLWDETHRRVNSELTHLQTVSTTCNLFEEQKLDLSKALKQDSEALKVIDAAIDSGKLTESVTASVKDVAKLLNEKRKLPGGKVKNQTLSFDQIELSKADKSKKEDRMSDSGTSGYESCSSDDLSERERRLAYLRRLAKDLQSSLVPGTTAWNEVNATLDQAEKELKELQDHCRMLIMKTAETLEPNPKSSRFSSNCKRRNWVRETKRSRSPRSERRVRVAGNRRSSSTWVWRVARAALPFQVALMLVLCVAYLLEPNCCDSVNTFNLSFTPQLRFVHGSPPV